MRSEIVRQRERKAEARRAHEEKAMREGALEKNIERALMAEYIFFAGPEVLLTRSKVARLVGLHWDGLKASLDVRGQRRSEFGGIVFEVATVESVALLCDSGKLGVERMGRIEAYPFASAADLSHPALYKRNVSFLRRTQDAKGGDHGALDGWFDVARQGLFIGKTDAARYGSSPETWPVTMQQQAWAAVDGDPARGPVTTLEDAAPFEVGIVNKHGYSIVLYARSLKGAWSGRKSSIWYDSLEEGENSDGREAQQDGVAGEGPAVASGS